MSAVGVRPRALGVARCVCQEVAGRQSRRLSVARIAVVNAMGTTQPHQAMAVAGGFPKSHAARHIGPQLILGYNYGSLLVLRNSVDVPDLS